MSIQTVRNKKPQQLKKVRFSLPEMAVFKLDNELEVYFVQKTNLPFLNMTLVTEAGSKFDPTGKKGLANLLAMVIDEGAGEYDALQLSDQFEILGAHFNVSCDQDSLYMSLQVLKDEFAKGLDLFASIVTEPHLHEDDFNREKRKVKTRILQSRDDAEEVADEVFEYKLYGKENPYAFPVIGYENDLDSITLQDLKEYYYNIVKPADSFLVIVGDYETERLKNLLNKQFQNWKGPSSHKTHITFNSPTFPGLYVVDRKDSVQSEIRTGLLSYKRNEYDFYARSVLNLTLGGQFSSRLNLNLREQKGFTYGVTSRFIYLKSSAYFIVSTSVSSENTGAAFREIMDEIKNIRSGVTKKELDFAKSSLIRKFPSGFETYRQIASNIIGQIIHSLPSDYFKTYSNEIKQVTQDRVKKAAEDNLISDRLTTVIVGNKDKIADQMKEIYKGKLILLDEKGNESGDL